MKMLFFTIALFALPTVVNADEMCDSMGKLAAQVYTQKAAGEDMRSILRYTKKFKSRSFWQLNVNCSVGCIFS